MSGNWASYSSLTTHRACPQKWKYSNIDGLRKKDKDDVKVEMEFGIWWHALRAADSIERGRVLGSLVEGGVPKELKTVDDTNDTKGPVISTDSETLVEDVLEAAGNWWWTLTPLTHEIWTERLGEGLVPRLTYINEEWKKQWAEELHWEEPMAVEYRWRRELPELPQPDGTAKDPDTAMVGYVDEIFFDRRRQMVVVRDHKSHKGLSAQSTADDLLDSQLQIYSWGASLEVTSWGRGGIKAVAYDRVRSVKPKTPKLNLSGTLSKSITDFDARTYEEWANGPDGEGIYYPGLKKDKSNEGYYRPDPDMIEAMNRPDKRTAWFQRTLTPLNRNIVKTHLRSAVDSAIDVQLTKERVELTGEAARNMTSMGCRWCDFAPLCRAQMVGGPEGEYDLESMYLETRPKRGR